VRQVAAIEENRLPCTVILQAPDVGPHPENRDADTDPVWYPHARVMLATPKAFETVVVKVAPEPEALLHITALSETHILARQPLRPCHNRGTPLLIMPTALACVWVLV